MPRVTKPKEEDVPEVKAKEVVAPQIRKIERRIQTVLIEVPVCIDPPGVANLTGSHAAHVYVDLFPSQTKSGRLLVHQLYHACLEMNARLKNGKPVTKRGHAITWLVEQLGDAIDGGDGK